MRDHDLDAPNLNTVREPHGRSRRFLDDDPPMSLEDDASMSVEDDASMSVEDDASMGAGPSVIKRPSRASTVFLFLFMVLAGVGGALAWHYYDQATDMIRALALAGATSKPPAPPEAFAELQQQLKSISADLTTVKHT